MTVPEVIQHWEHKLKTDKNSMWERQVILQTLKVLKKSLYKESRFCKHCGERIE